MATIFNASTSGSPEQRVVAQIDQQIVMAANAMKRSYDAIRRMVYQNPAIKNPDAVYAAFAQYTQTGLTPEQLGQTARLIKAACNTFQPGVIADDVPEAIITF